ncbi:TPA: restriction endonuclease subunit S [Campylobacter upsaliensis]|nr:restriction endonuclease subunit S [Campylobacter upsaliensis]HEP3232772.1 restriction endonuclease subunit S [Campylobacter upsaliensis]HEP3234506.1 restriction endonuclease subunit S [Campylobacter upsaliensis]
MKTDTLKKSLLDYAIKGSLTAKFRRENAGLNAFDELEIYNDEIKQKRKDLEKKLKKCEKEFKLEKDKDKKALLKSQIQILKKELTKCKEITPLNLSEAPFEIPNSWAWVKLGDICEIVSGGTPSRDKIEYWHNGTIPWVKIADVKNNVVNQTQEFITELGLENSSAKIFKKGTLLYTIFATLGETAILNIDAATNQAIAALIETYDYDTKFLMYCLMSMKDYVNSLGRGVAQNNINQTMLKNFTIPLPPLCEQQEIVKKLDLLVTLANDFAITKENLKRIEKRIEKSLLKLALEGSLSKLYRRSSPTLSAFNEINTYNEAIKEKRKDLEKKLKICEKELKLEKDKDKKALFKSQIQILKKEIAKCKEITPLNLSEAPFEIPSSTWAWVKGCDIFLPIDNTEPQGDFFKYIDIDSIDNKNKKVKSPKTIETKNASSRARRPLEYGDVLFSMVRPYLENIALIDETLADCIASTGFFVCRTNILDSRFLYYLMTSPYVVYGLNSFMKGDNSPSIVKDDILNFNYPLPPLCEQEYIVQTLNTLFTLKKGLRVD